MQTLHPIKVRSAVDSAHEDGSPLATGHTPLQSKQGMLSGDTEALTKKWSSKTSIPIGDPHFRARPATKGINDICLDPASDLQGWQFTS